MRPHAVQQSYRRSPARFNVVPAGRRSGKTELAKRKLVYRSLRGTDFMPARFFAAAPTRDQAKKIWWDDLKALSPRNLVAGSPSETELSIRYLNGSELHVLGMDKPERVEGTPWDGGVLDEYGNMKKDAWTAHVQPALADRNGWCDFIGVPEGWNHYAELYERARFDKSGEWAAFHWVSADILSPEAIATARRDLDELTFQQEYEASFVNFTGRAYYPFGVAEHCAPLSYDPEGTLVLCFDFNVSPGIAAICQEQVLPNQQRGTGVIGQVWIRHNSQTPMVCSRLIQDWGQHKGPVHCYGDATGGSRGTAKVAGSDWDLIRKILGPVFGQRLRIIVPEANPKERVRVNSVNSRLKSVDGTIRLMVDPTKAPNVVRDFERVRVVDGGSGEIDKNADPELTHLSDAIGYHIVREFPIVEYNVGMVKLTGY